MDSLAIALVAATFLVAGWVKGVIGLGLPMVSLALLSATLGLPVALQLMVIPSAATNLWQAVAGGALGPLLRRFWSLLVASVMGVWLAYGLLFVAHPEAMTALLGVVLCVYGLTSLGRVTLVPPVRHEALASPAVGLATGVLAGATGTLIMPVLAYLQTLGLKRDELVQMMGISFTVSTGAIALSIAEHGNWNGSLLALSLAALVPALIGMKLGQALRARLSEAAFRRWLFISLTTLGLRLIWSGIA